MSQPAEPASADALSAAPSGRRYFVQAATLGSRQSALTQLAGGTQCTLLSQAAPSMAGFGQTPLTSAVQLLLRTHSVSPPLTMPQGFPPVATLRVSQSWLA